MTGAQGHGQVQADLEEDPEGSGRGSQTALLKAGQDQPGTMPEAARSTNVPAPAQAAS